MNLLAELQRAMSGEPDAIPKGFKTCEQWAAEWNLSIPHARKCLQAGLNAKPPKIERQKFRAMAGEFLRPVPHYKDIRKC